MAESSQPTTPRTWREGPAQRADRDGESARRRRLFMLQAAMMAIVGAIVGMLYWLRPIPTPRPVPLWASYPKAPALTPLPHAKADLDAIAPSARADDLDGLRLDAELKRIREIRGVPVVAYLRAYAAVNVAPAGGSPPSKVAPGEPMILPADAGPADPAGWRSVREVLDALAACRAANKLLVLDLSPLPAGPVFDPFRGDLGDRIEATILAVKDPTLLVLTSCSPGEEPLASDAMGRSVFSFYWDEGVRGWADLDGNALRRDGIVTVGDVAGFVSAHVDRWAVQNRRARQRPVLYQGGRRLPHREVGDSDFALAVLSRGRARPRLALAEPRAYPDWLLRGWRRRDHWKGAGVDRLVPWAFRAMEAALLRADAAWRGGSDPMKLRPALEADLGAFVRSQGRARPPSGPASRSLYAPGAEVAIDETLVAAARALATALSSAAADADPKKLQEAADALPARFASAPDAHLAYAVFDASASIPAPSGRDLRLLDGLLRARRADPRTVETLALRRLADLATADPTRWAPGTAHRLLEVVRKSGRAESRPDSLAWVRRRLDEATRLRHEGEILLFERAYASTEAADEALARSERRYDEALDAQRDVEAARSLADDASLLLSDAAPYLDQAPGLDDPWRGAAGLAREVDEALRPGPASGPADAPGDDLAPRVGALRQKADALRDRLDEIRRALDGRAEGLARGPLPDEPDAVASAAIEALLATPLPDAATRLGLWTTGQGLDRRLAEATRALDAETTWAATEDGPESTADDPGDGPAAALRSARRSADLLALGGLPRADLARLAEAIERASSPASGADDRLARDLGLALALRVAWVDDLPKAVAAALDADPDAADRLSGILPPLATFPRRADLAARFEDPATNPNLRLRLGREGRLRGWLADRYEDEGEDLGGAEFFLAAARELRGAATPTQRASVRFGRPSAAPELTPESPTAGLSIEVSVARPEAGASRVILEPVGVDPRWLRVTPGDRGAEFPVTLDVPPTGRPVGFRVTMPAASAETGSPPPAGFLVRARVDGRSAHARVPVTLTPASERLGLLLSDDPESPSTPRGDLQLRPVAGRQGYYLYVFNPTARARKVAVGLKVGEVPVPGGSATLTVGPGKAERVAFETPPAPGPGVAEPELAELRGPIDALVTDADRPGRALSRRRLDVGVASAAEYVRVEDASIQPPKPGGGTNRLAITLAASGPIAGPPCVAELVLPRDRIPRLDEAPEGGTFRGIIPADGGPITLSADALKLADVGEPRGHFYVNIDGRRRALIFRASFARVGDATRPRLDFEPDLRLRADAAAATGPKLAVDVEVDNPPPGATLELSRGRLGDSGFEPEVVLPRLGPYRRRVGFGMRAGGLAFEVVEADWSIPIETAGVEGRRALRARLLGPDGGIVREAIRPLTLDGALPTGVGFVGLPAQARRGSTVRVRASGRPSGSGVKQVVVFVGKPVDGKRPADATIAEARPVEDAPSTWEAALRLPDTKGPTTITAQFLSGIDRSAFALGSIDLTDADPVIPGKIRGKVLEGDRPQPGLDVYLTDAKNVLKDRTRTGQDGTFLFEGLEKGPYTVTSVKPSTPADGQATVQVVPDSTATAEVALKYRVR